MTTFQPVKLSDKVFWVGAVDWNLRNFHGLATSKGSTYNAYLVMDEKIALIDTVKAPFSEELIERISSVVNPQKINYIIINHVEMDHAGSLDKIKELAPAAEIVTNKRAADDLNRHFKKGWSFKIIKTGDVLQLGKLTLSFIEMPMVHWPDSMATYCPEGKTLFPNDMFGQHLASLKCFDDEFDWEFIRRESENYYANILMPFPQPVKKALDAASKLNIKIIAPSHGIIWRSERLKNIIDCYKNWSSNATKRKAVIVYDTMWNSTQKMANALAQGFSANLIDTHIFNLKTNDLSEITTEIQEAKIIAVGSPTLNNGVMPTVGAFLTYLKGLKPQGRVGFAFGSFGWSGQGTKEIETFLSAVGIEIVNPAINCRYIPDDKELTTCFDAAKEISKNVAQKDTP